VRRRRDPSPQKLPTSAVERDDFDLRPAKIDAQANAVVGHASASRLRRYSQTFRHISCIPLGEAVRKREGTL